MLKGLLDGVRINISEQKTDKSEAEFVARTIESMMGGLKFFSIDSDITQGNEEVQINSLSDFAVLCRIHRQMSALEKAFQDHSIPYQTVGETPFFKQEPIRSVIDLLKLALHPENTFLKTRLIRLKRLDPTQIINSSAFKKEKDTVSNAIGKMIDLYFNEEKSKDENVFKKLLSMADEFGNDFDAFLKSSTLGTGIDTYKSDTETVTLMSLHAAKGLEFECVFIVGCEEGLLPYSIFEIPGSDVEEERRLLYVGMTRAKRFLFLTHAERRFLYGREYRLKRSPYLNHIEDKLIELSKSEFQPRIKMENNQLGLF